MFSFNIVYLIILVALKESYLIITVGYICSSQQKKLYGQTHQTGDKDRQS